MEIKNKRAKRMPRMQEQKMEQELKQFEETIGIQRYSIATSKTYRFHIKNFLKFCSGKPAQDRIKPYLYHLSKYKPSSLNTAKYSILYFFKDILNQEINVNIPVIKKEKLLPRTVNRDIIKKIIDVTTNLKHKILIKFLYGSGLRLGEIVKVRWNELDFENKLVLVKGKGNKERFAKIPNNIIEDLKKYEQERDNKKSVYIFDSLYRPYTHISKRTVQQVIKNAIKKLKLDIKVSPHCLRHSYATHSLENGIDSRYIQKLLGHSNIRTTERYMEVTKTNLANIQSPLDVAFCVQFNTI